MAYAITHPERVSALLLRGIFLLTKKELTWFYQHGASMIFPDAWESFVAPIPEAERQHMFERGVQLDEQRPGSGLGLDIVRALAETYGGSVQALASPLGGARLRLCLPAAD